MPTIGFSVTFIHFIGKYLPAFLWLLWNYFMWVSKHAHSDVLLCLLLCSPRAPSAELLIQNLAIGEENWLMLLWFMVSPNPLTQLQLSVEWMLLYFCSKCWFNFDITSIYSSLSQKDTLKFSYDSKYCFNLRLCDSMKSNILVIF